MKLQFIVVETGERWRRALLRMVLDQKLISHNDYGSFHTPSETGSLHHTALNVSDDFVDNSDHDSPDTLRIDGEMTRDQRQPLLPLTNGHQVDGGWKQSASPTIEYYDDASLALDQRKIVDQQQLGNGVVQIDIPAPQREVQRFPKEKWKTLVAFLILVVSFISTTVSLAMVHDRRPLYPPLPDIILDNVEQAKWALDVSEYLIIVSNTFTIILLVFHKHKFIIMRRVFMLLALLYFMRSITMYVTALPMADPTYQCSPQSKNVTALVIVQRAIKLMTGFGLSINHQHVFCGDFIYSGHTVILVMAYLVIAEYAPRRCYLVQWLQFCISGTGMMLVLVAHGHYTIDVIIAYYVTTTLFWSYHTLANNAILKHCSSTNFLSRHWWFLLFLYFEKNVDGCVPRLYEWPLPWPRRCIGKHPNRNS